MPHFPYNDFDMSGIKNLVEEAKNYDMQADFDLRRKNQGIVTVTIKNWCTNDDSIVFFEIHKVGKKRLIGAKISWIIQLYSMKDSNAPLIKHGCISGNYQASAIHQAKIDVKFGFLSICDFELAYSAAIE